MDLSEIQNTILDRRTKGIPGSSEPFPLKELKNKKWNILKEDMPMPLMVLKQKNYLHNLKTFSNYLEKHNLDIAPHGKTTMAPQIFSEQIKHGAWGITAGAINQIQVMFDFGIKKSIAKTAQEKETTEEVSKRDDAEFTFSKQITPEKLIRIKGME